jgi:hypothetical protein
MEHPYMPLGTVFSGGTPYGLVSTSTPLPSTVNVGNSGPFYSLTYWHDSTMATRDAMLAVTYSIKANNSSTLLACFSFAISGVTSSGTADQLQDGTETDCYSVDAAGSASLVSVTVTVGGVALTFQ